MAALAQMALPDGPRGRLMAVGLTLLVLAALWLGVVQPVMDAYQSGADALAQRRALVGRMQDVAGTLPALKREAAAAASAGPPPASVLEGATDAIAAASLQGLLESMTGSAGAHLTSAEALPAEQVGAYRRVSLRVSVDATWPTLIALMQKIEQATPRMFVDELQLHAQPTSEKTRELPLDISFVLLAFRAASGSGNSPAAPAADSTASDPDAAAPADQP